MNPNAHEKSASLSAPRILVVDDDSTIRNFMLELLSEEGYRVQSALSGEDGLHALEAARFDLAIVDINLPGWITGLDLLREIRSLCPQMKLIVCSAQNDTATFEKAMKHGAKAFIEKPIEDLDRLLDLVKKTLQVGVNHAPESEK